LPGRIHHRLLDMLHAAAEQHRQVGDVASVCLRMVLELSDASAAAVYLRDEQTQVLRCLAIDGVSDDEDLVAWQTLADRVMATGKVSTRGATMALPLERGTAREGVLVLQGVPKELAKAGSGGDNLLDLAASNLAASVDHARLVQKYAQKVVRLQQLERVSEVLNGVTGDEGELKAALSPILKLVSAEGGWLYLVGQSGQLDTVAVEAGFHLERRQGWAEDCRACAEEVRRLGRPLNVSPERTVVYGGEQPIGRSLDHVWPAVGCALGVPIRARIGVLGVLVVTERTDGQPFSNWDLVELSSVASHVAYVVDNIRLLQRSSKSIQRLQRLQEVSGILSSSLNQREVRGLAMHAATQLVDAETGSLLLLDPETNELYFDVALGEKGERVRQIRLKLGEGIAGHVAGTGEPLLLDDVQNDPRFSRTADKKSGFVTRNMICVPVRVRDKLLGVLQAINKRRGGRFDEGDLQDFIGLSQQVGIAIENANLYDEINRLFEGFINASVLAIESRDPTTSGHSARVALLCGALAEVVSATDDGPYRSVVFGPDALKELRYAAILHDFGKVGVREHVLVKARKLFDGDFALIKARFDFIKRTYEVRAMQRKLEIVASGESPRTTLLAEVDRNLLKQLAEADGLLEFVRSCNEPAALRKDGLERLHDLAGLQFDYFGEPKPYLSAEELYALSIPRGTLTPDERLEIETHVTHTYRFLSMIPWSRSLANVPMIAYRHHEKLDGSGYPLQVSGEMVPVQSRIMTICDIYDALTASDRPYKAAMGTDQALGILEDEVRQGKVDEALLELFIEHKVYLRVRPGEQEVGIEKER
jgi:HD-GYP domain-containing protein (c-di-GMP phosphodiesterase class II)